MSPPKSNSKTNAAMSSKHSAEDVDAGPPAKRTRRGQGSPSKESSDATLDEESAAEASGLTVENESPAFSADGAALAPENDINDVDGTNTSDIVGGSAHHADADVTSALGSHNTASNQKITVPAGGKGKGKENAEPGPSSTNTMTSANTSDAPDPRVTFTRLRWFSNDLMKRIPPMLVYTMPADHQYSLSMVPLDNIGWGETATSSGKLCLLGGCIPITIWVIGVIDSLWLFDRKGLPDERITIGVAPLTDHAMMVARNLLATHSRPPSAISSMLTHVSASRWMSLRISGERAPQILEFEKVYNAKARYGAKNTMTQLPAEKLKKGDLVLLEAQISRYNSAPKPANGKGKNLKPSEFVQWKATFDLMAISLLETGPNVALVDDDVPTISDATFSL